MAKDMSASNADYPRPAYAWLVVAILLLAYTISFVDRQILSLMVQPIRRDLGISDTAISLLQGLAFAAFYTFLGVFLGLWADRGKRKAMMIGGIVLWSLATAACGLAHDFHQLFVARMLVGVGEATLSPAAYSLIADYFPRSTRSRAMGVYTMGIFMGSGAAQLLGGLAVKATASADHVVLPVIGAVLPWQAAFILVGLPGLVVGVLMLLIREPSRKEIAGGQGVGLRATAGFLRRRGGLIGLMVCSFGCNAVLTYSISSWLPTTFIRVHGWTAPQLAAAYGTILLTIGCVGIVLGGWMADRGAKSGRHGAVMTVAMLGVAGTIPLVWAVGMAANPWLAIMALAWVTFWLGLPTGLAPPMLNAVTPNQYRGQVTALYLFAVNLIGLGMGPTFVALLTDHVFHNDLAVGRSLAIATTLAAIASLLLLSLARRGYAAAAAETAGDL